MDCFSDRFIRQLVARQSTVEGFCESCQKHRAAKIDCGELNSEFSLMLSLYEQSPEGVELIVLVERDWQLFSSEVVDKLALLQAILPESVGCRYIDVSRAAVSAQEQWLELKRELRYQNRFFPASAPDRDELSNLLGLLVISHNDLPRHFFRARVNRGEAMFALGDLQAPPTELAQGGRANPPGLSYLYVASDQRTAICEVRPTVADQVAVARFEQARPFSIIDLSDPRAMISPFGVEHVSLANVQASMGLLMMLSEDLTKPTPPHKAAFDYLATQYLCELIKTLGYHGVRYRSSLGEGGYNFAFFDPGVLVPVEMLPVVEVRAIQIELV